MINIFYKDYPEKLIVTSLSINSAQCIAKPSVNPAKALKQKHNCFAKNVKK